MAVAVLWLTIGAQPPVIAQDGNASITARVYYQGRPELRASGAALLIPSNTEQPIPIDTVRSMLVELGEDGRVGFSNLPAGDYFFGLFGVAPTASLPSLEESILIEDGRFDQSIPAATVRLADGEHIELDIPIVIAGNQETPEPTPLPVHSGGISGRISITGLPPGGTLYIRWIPADATQPIYWDLYSGNSVAIRADGTFSITNLPDGDYFLVLPGTPVTITPLSAAAEATRLETVEIRIVADIPELRDGTVIQVPVVRVSVTDGRAVTGIDLLLSYATPQRVPGFAGLPSAGAGWQGARASIYLAGLLAGLSVVGIAAGAALVRRRLQR
jgi:hypothetical protein